MYNTIRMHADTPTLFSHECLDEMNCLKRRVRELTFDQLAEYRSEYAVASYTVIFSNQWHKVMLDLRKLVDQRLLNKSLLKSEISKALRRNESVDAKAAFIECCCEVDEPEYLSNFFDKHLDEVKNAELVKSIKSKIKRTPGLTSSELFFGGNSDELAAYVLEDNNFHSFDGKFCFGNLGNLDNWGKPELLMYVRDIQAKLSESLE